MGSNDAAEMLAVAQAECIRLENELKSERAAAQGVVQLFAMALLELGGTLTISDQALNAWTGEGVIYTDRDMRHRTTILRVALPCNCTQTPPEMHTLYGSAVEPGSTLEPNPGCPQHFPTESVAP